jgi:hypothetical protein
MPPLFDFAPGEVCLASAVAAAAVRPYRTLSPLPGQSRGGMLSVALSLTLLAQDRRELPGTVPRWSPDFPLLPP